MARGDSLDNLIRVTMREQIAGQAPSASVREGLLAEAARNKSARSALGPSIPPLVRGLRESDDEGSVVSPPGDRVSWGPNINGPWILLVAPIYAIR